MSVQEALKLLRYESGYTQIDFANEIGRAFITVNRWENGKGFPSRTNSKTILDFAQKHNVSAECISYLEEVLLPDSKRNYSALSLGFPDIDRDFLFQLADESTNALYVIEAGTYNLLYTNRQAEKMSVDFLKTKAITVKDRCLSIQKDKRCFNYFMNRNSPCEQCPLSRVHGEDYIDVVLTMPKSERKFKVHAKLTETKTKKVYVIYLTEITHIDTERKSLYELTNDIPDGVGIYNVFHDGRIELVFMNQKLYKMFDEDRRNVLRRDGVSDLCLVHPDDRPELDKEVKNSVLEKRNVSIDLNMRLEDGKYHLVHIHAKIIRTDSDKNVYYCLFRYTDKK